MSTSYIDIEDLGRIKLFRRRGLKYIRLSVNSFGEVRLSVPWYIPKSAGIRYLNSKKDWIKSHQKTIRNNEWKDGRHLVNGYKLKIVPYHGKNSKNIVSGDNLYVHVPVLHSKDKRQKTIDNNVKKFIKTEAEKVMVPLAARLAKEQGLSIKEVKVRHLKSRWGSCSHDKVITLNSSLLSLPEELMKYVIFHELAHIKHLNHSRQFWQEVETMMPDYKKHRKALKTHNRPGVF